MTADVKTSDMEKQIFIAEERCERTVRRGCFDLKQSSRKIAPTFYRLLWTDILICVMQNNQQFNRIHMGGSIPTV